MTSDQKEATISRMEPRSTSLRELLDRVPTVLKELATEFYRVGGRSMDIDPNSQTSACFLLGFRSTSLLWGMKSLLEPTSRDSWDVLVRSFMETRDLLLTFRFDDNGIRNTIRTWCQGKNGSSWRARHKKTEEFVKKIGGGDTELGRRWSAFSALSHPTVHAAKHSTSLMVTRVTGRSEDYDEAMNPKIADYLASVGTLIVATTFDEFPELIPLGCDLNRMPNVEPFRLSVARTIPSVLGVHNKIALPPDSSRSLRAEGPMDLSAAAARPASCIGPSLGVLGFAEDSAASG